MLEGLSEGVDRSRAKWIATKGEVMSYQNRLNRYSCWHPYNQ